MSENEETVENRPVIPTYPTTLAEVGTFLGREEIRTTIKDITPENVLSVLQKAIPVFERNKADIEFLYRYYLGLQPILNRVKVVRPEICNKIVVNHASEVVDFFVGYIFGDAIVYSGRAEADCSEEIQMLNSWNIENGAEQQNITVGTWLNICGQAYKIAFPRSDSIENSDDITSPYATAALDPREAFVVYYNGLEKIPVMGVKVVDTSGTDAMYTRLYCVWTKDRYYEIPNTEVGMPGIPSRIAVNPIGEVPVVEYMLNVARRGRIEPVIPILDALNIIASNRTDGIEQFIQNILLLRNVDLSADDVKKLSQFGAVKYKDLDPSMPGEVRYITAELNQEGAQTLKDDLYNSFLIISGMPNRNTGNGDNGVAVVYRDGWSAAETKAKETEKFFSWSEKRLVRVILRIIRGIRPFNAHLPNISVNFTRKNYENIQTKSQVLTTMLSNEKIAPRLAFTYCGMFADPEAAYRESMEYYDTVPVEKEIADEDNIVAGSGTNGGNGLEPGRSGGNQNRTRETGSDIN